MARLELRMTDAQKDLLKEASETEGMLTGPWVKANAIRRAKAILSKAKDTES